MGPFIIGILVGWLAEWIFFTFFVKGKQQTGDNSNTTALQAELSAKNKEIKALQAKLADATAGTGTGTGTGTGATKPASSTAGKTETKAAAQAPAKTASNKAPVQKAPKAAPKKVSEKKPAAKKASEKKPAPKPAPKKAATKPARKSKAAKAGDDFTKLSGIGPSMSATLNELGIDTFKKLAAMDDDILRDMLEASGARLNNNKEAMDSWNEQAMLADKGDFEGLKKLQEALKKK